MKDRAAISVLNRLIGVGVVLLALLAGYRLTRPALPFLPRSSRPLKVVDWRDYGERGIRRGSDSGRVVLVVWSDHLCGPCYDAEEELQVLIQRFPRTLSVVYRHRPALGSVSRLAAIALQCASQQDRFEEMHQLLFAWSDSLGFVEWRSYAASAGIADLAPFDKCLWDDRQAAEMVDRDGALADRLDISGTPAVLLDSLLFRGFPGRRYVVAYVRAQQNVER